MLSDPFKVDMTLISSLHFSNAISLPFTTASMNSSSHFGSKWVILKEARRRLLVIDAVTQHLPQARHQFLSDGYSEVQRPDYRNSQTHKAAEQDAQNDR
jgi:hypothetical protein